ncbi:bifunctional 3'-5' exonuclease/DNA polymerase [Microbacterium xanthum]|uniref:bifunctional 3'-5' exonuclease/DNA polymerase n=1 Tax=Microbacterium xanthum TaxID=3079794 RepID=UPI003A0FECF3
MRPWTAVTASAATSAEPPPTWTVVGDRGDAVVLADLDPDARELRRVQIAAVDLPGVVAERERSNPARWVWHDSAQRYPPLLDAGVRVARCHDLRLARRILAGNPHVADGTDLRRDDVWSDTPATPVLANGETLFDLGAPGGGSSTIEETLAEFARQRRALRSTRAGTGLHLLVAAESAGALIACEMHAAGLPWDETRHGDVLVSELGPRPAPGTRPVRLEDLASRLRAQLEAPGLNPDSPVQLLRALQRQGLPVGSTGRWELAGLRHPAVPTVLEYKRLARLWAANGWAWLDEWVRQGRFRPVYIPAGVVTGRWASAGGGALQIPRGLRVAVRADPGWRLVVADVAQLEPRVLCAMSRDMALADAARGRDLYEGIVAGGAVTNRDDAKIAMLGAMYGATTGESGRLVPRLRRAYPRAMGLVDAAARRGEDGESVATLLGRTSPEPDGAWVRAQSRASEADAREDEVVRARRSARERGRFTRNFVVQGTAAEWALSWLADLRMRLASMPEGRVLAPGSGPVFARRAHIAFFLHDEVIVHCPEEQAHEVVGAVRAAANTAGRLLFGDFPLDFPLDARATRTAAKD